ncbi:MAG TPA: pyridoxamine 5'-phosphate oxidase family protein [Anaeromyxobacteraceae bacterium]|nr:pyridoxamine 5'-phosphate oxidase family protein [Anaeromyxobacteraceae bacterium]
MKLTREMQEALRIVGAGGAVVYLTTASAAGKPNTVGERFVAVHRDEYILVAEMFAQKTRVNLNENPRAVITMAHPLRGRTWAFSGPTAILQEGHPPDHEFEGLRADEVLAEWGDWAEKEPPSEVPPDIRPPALVQRGVIVMKVEAVHDFAPASAGRKLL